MPCKLFNIWKNSRMFARGLPVYLNIGSIMCIALVRSYPLASLPILSSFCCVQT